MSFVISEAHLESLFRNANLQVPGTGMVFVGIRGCTPVPGAIGQQHGDYKFELPGVDYQHMRCSILQWTPGTGFSAFPASTVPHISAIRDHIKDNGENVNQLALGFYAGNHAYVPGEHRAGDPMRAHRAFRNLSPLPTWRTGNDDQYAGDDRLTYGVAMDNIHCAWQMDPSAPSYSSNGCQVIAGRPRVLARGWQDELGPWAAFMANTLARPQARYPYALFAGREVLGLIEAQPGDRWQTLRFGSQGELVHVLQDALMKRGYDIGPGGADGDLGWNTLQAIRELQLKALGPSNVDLVVGPGTAEALGIRWPREHESPPPYVAPSSASGAIILPPASPGTTSDERTAPAFRSLAGGPFSSDPYNLSEKRSFRTNNPGALNVTPWQRARKGYVGSTLPDSAGNVTSIYVTPEHGIAAWYFLLSDRYGFKAKGSFTVGELAQRYAGNHDVTSPAVTAYLRGWGKWANGALVASTDIRLDDDSGLWLLARAMFSHEFGGATRVTQGQVSLALQLEREGTLPEA